MTSLRNFLEVLTLFYTTHVLLAEFILKDESVINGPLSLTEANCTGPQTIGFKEFEIEKFLGDWYELFKTHSGFANLKSGLWRLQMTEDKKLLFTYSANTDDKHCINPVRGELQLTGDKPGEMVLKYVRFNSRVEEKFQVIYLDKKYETAVAYACYRHLSDGKRCDPRALYAAILSRKQSSQLPSDLTLVTQHLYIDRDLMIPQRPYNCDLNHYEPDDELDSEQSWEPELCHEHPERGHCDQSQVNYYYSPLSGQCETFLYSGCGGNRNNFISLQECQQQCVDKTGTFMCPDTATCALTCPLCCEEENGCIECNCGTETKEVVHSSPVPHDKLPFDPDCLGSPNDCPETCDVIEFNVGCYKCDCYHSNVSEVDMVKESNVHSSSVPQDKLPFDPDCLGSPNDCPETCDVIEFNVECYKCDCNNSSNPQIGMTEVGSEIVYSPSVPQDKLPFDPDCLGSPNDCPETCVVIEFNVGCYKCDCNHSQINMAEAGPQIVHSSPSPQDKLPFDPDCLGSPNDCPETCDVIEFNVGCYKCNCNHSNVSEVDMVEESNVHSSSVPQEKIVFQGSEIVYSPSVPQDKLPFDPDCLGSPNDCPETCVVIEFNVGCYKCDCNHSQINMAEAGPQIVHSSPSPQDKLPFDPDCLGSPNDCPETCDVIEFNVGCYKCNCNHSNVSEVDMVEERSEIVYSPSVPQDKLPFDPDCLGSPNDCPETCDVIEFNVGCYKCDCNHSQINMAEAGPQIVHSSPLPQDKLPFDPDCLGSPNDCPETCVVIEFNVGCYKCDCYHSNVSEVDMVEKSNVHSPSVPQDKLPFDPDCLGSPNDCPETCDVIEFNVGCYKCDCNNSQINMAEAGPQVVHSSPSPQDKLPFDPDCLGSPNDCPETCDVIEFNVGCYKCDCYHSNVSEVDMVKESNVHSPSVPQDKLPFDPDCLGSPNDCPETCVVIEFNVGCYKCDCNHSQINMAEAGPQVVHSSPLPQDKLPFDPDCLGSPNDCPETCDVIEFNVGCYKCDCYHSNVSEVDMVEEKHLSSGHPEIVHSSTVPQNQLPFDQGCLGSPNDCPETCVVIEFNVGCYKCDCNHSNDTQVNMTAEKSTTAEMAHYEDIYPVNKASECLSSCRVTSVKKQLLCICNNLQICHQPKKAGFCRARKPRYYYNPKKGKCELFYYGGCGGNANRFTTFEECEDKCHDRCDVKSKEVSCSEEAHKGNYYFDLTKKLCFKLPDGRCTNGINSFDDQEQCIATCEDRCNLPKKSGPCKGSFVRYFHNSINRQCEKFYFSGCGGNTNNFLGKEECEQKCGADWRSIMLSECPINVRCKKNCVIEEDLNGCLKCNCNNLGGATFQRQHSDNSGSGVANEFPIAVFSFVLVSIFCGGNSC
ncbi:uncharacterized protein LOC143247747 isoform X2 [Tachypleus tridentatus]|uniref:uncharacterized protein LOC143247747 isoform X2 n=1 Tax=Tachypleus tridentatus TaxID=6853 RepID=UPI003FD45A24